jgi:uncharacterized protein YjbJ (UPF0337 family)
MNRDQIKGRAKDAAGYVQQKAGKLAGSPKQRAKGLMKQAVGKVQKTVGDSNERQMRRARNDGSY